MERTIRVTGKGKVSLSPDLIRLSITLSNTKEQYSEAIEHHNEMLMKLQKCLEKIGFKREELKTVSFSIDTRYESVEKNNRWISEFVGYQYNHQMKLEFENDNELLGKVLSQLSSSKTNVEFSIQYTVKNEEKAKNLLLRNAVKDAKQKASILAKASSVNLGEVLNIDYSFQSVTFETMPINRLATYDCAMKANSIDIQADDIVVEDSVTVIYSIK